MSDTYRDVPKEQKRSNVKKMKPYHKDGSWGQKWKAEAVRLGGKSMLFPSREQKLIARNANRSLKKGKRQELKRELQRMIDNALNRRNNGK